MRQLKSGSFFLLFFIMCCFQSRSQEVINAVSIHKINNSLFKVQYRLHPTTDYSIEGTILKIFRRRNGKVEEIFAKKIVARSLRNDQKIFYWKPTAGLLKTGDELQARIALSMQPSIAKQKGKTLNKPPYTDAGQPIEVQLPVTKSIILNGSKSHDLDGRLTSVQWKQISGPTNLSISNKDSLIAFANGDFKEGTYAFELSVKDNQGATSIARTILHVKPAAPVVVATPPKTAVPKKDSAVHTIAKSQEKTKLKGGPLNAAINLAIPGLGHYFVSGNYRGENRKLASFIPTLMYAGAIGGAFYFQGSSNTAYKKYMELANYKEYQRDANGTIIGMRGAKEAEANKYYTTAKTNHQFALISLGVGGAVLAGDFIYTFFKGMKNKKEWQHENTSFKPNLFISSNGTQTMVGVQFKF